MVYKYEKAFPITNSNLLRRTYLVRLDSNTDYTQTLSNFYDVDFVEKIIEFDDALYEPNDYRYPDLNAQHPRNQ